jgi:hypothetical protein
MYSSHSCPSLPTVIPSQTACAKLRPPPPPLPLLLQLLPCALERRGTPQQSRKEAQRIPSVKVQLWLQRVKSIICPWRRGEVEEEEEQQKRAEGRDQVDLNFSAVESVATCDTTRTCHFILLLRKLLAYHTTAQPRRTPRRATCPGRRSWHQGVRT